MQAGFSSGSNADWSSAFLDSSTLSQADCQRLLGLMAQAVWETDANGQVLVDSPSWRAYTGQSVEDWLGQGWLGTIHPQDQAYALGLWQEAVQRRQPVNAECRLPSPAGGWRWTNLKAMPVLNQNGSILKWLGVNIDISDKKQAQTALVQNQQRHARELETALHERTTQLQANQQLFQATLDASQDLIQVFEAVRDEQGEIVDFIWRLNNHAAEQYYGDVIGQRLLESNPGVVGTGIFATFKQVIETGVPDQSERHYVYEQFNGWFYQSVVKLGDGVATTTADITPRKQAEQRLRESEQRFRQLADALPLAIWVTDAEGNVSFLNQWWAHYSGISFAPTTAWQIADDILHPEDGPKVAAAFQEAMRQGRGFEVEQRNRSATGEYRWFLNRAIPYRDPQTGQITQWVGSGVDIHDRKRAEQALTESEARFRSVVEQAPMAIGLLSGRDMIIELGNELIFAVVGKRTAVQGKPLLEALPELDTLGFLNRLQAVYDTGVADSGHGVQTPLIRHAQSHTSYHNFTFTPWRDGNGTIKGVMVLAVEVTQQLLAQQREATTRAQALRQQRIHEAIATSTPDLMYVFDLSYRFTYANQALLAMWGHSWEESIGKSLLEIGYEPWHAQLHEREIDQVVATKQSIRGEVSFPHATLGNRIYDYVFAPVLNDQGEVEAVAGTTRDITDIKQAQELIRQSEARYRALAGELEQQVASRTEELARTNEGLAASNAGLAEANRLLVRSNDNLQTFAYIASHDLQEPLRKIQQFGDLLKTRYASSVGDELVYLERMQSAAQRMSTLIKDLLDFSRISTQRESSAPVSLNEVISQELSTLELTIQETGAEVSVEPLPTVMGDASQLGQLFQNLLSNALKFHRTDGSGVGVAPLIVVRASRLAADHLPEGIQPSRSAQAYHRIEVADNGIGFEEKYLDRIFQVFQRLHGKGKFAGTGISLAICEKVVTNHGGAITAQSQPGQGAIFSIYLPA